MSEIRLARQSNMELLRIVAMLMVMVLPPVMPRLAIRVRFGFRQSPCVGSG